MGRKGLEIKEGVRVGKMTLHEFETKFVQTYDRSLQVYLNPENVVPVITLHDFGTGTNGPSERVMSKEDTDVLDKAHEILGKYILDIFQNPFKEKKSDET